MPLPVALIPVVIKGGSIVAGAFGVHSAIRGGMKVKKANDLLQAVQIQHEQNIKNFEIVNTITSQEMDRLGKLELEVLNSFNEFADVFERIKNRPIFEKCLYDKVDLPKYEGEEIRKVSLGAGVLLGSLGGAGLGTAGGFAASGATSAAVMVFGKASTGVAISSLSGVAQTNAVLAALGGGTLAAGGGGMAAGTVVLGVATLGVGLLVGGIVFNFTGVKLSAQSKEAWNQMKKAEAQIKKSCRYLDELYETAKYYYKNLSKVNTFYQEYLGKLKAIVNLPGHEDWNMFSAEEKRVTENTVLLVGLLYGMCKVEIVLKGGNTNDINTVNKEEVEKSVNNANVVLMELFNRICE